MARTAVDFPAFTLGLEALGDGVNFSPLVKIVRMQLVADTKGNFAGEHDPDGTPWAPLKRQRSTKGRAKKKYAARDRILQDKGKLRSSVASAFGANTVNREDDNSFEWGTNVPYGRYHQDGTKKMVARPFLGVGPALQKSIAELTEEWVADKVAEAMRAGNA